MERHEVLFFHKKVHRHTLVDEPRHRIGIKRRHDDRAIAVSRQPLDRPGYRRAKAHHDTPSLHLDRAQLRLITVAEDDHVMLLDIIFHDVRIRRGDDDFSFIKVGVLIPDDHLGVKCLQNIAVRRPRHRYDRTVVLLHVGFGDIVDRDQSLQLVLLIRDRQCIYILRDHEIPCIFQGNIAAHARHLPDRHIPHTGTDVVQKRRRIHLKMVQHILCLRADLSRPHRDIAKIATV